MLALLGPSGCGKTTALRLISGFERPDAGTVEVNGRRVASPTSMVPPERRRVGLVFQDLALFPHLSVRDNVAYGIRRDPDHARAHRRAARAGRPRRRRRAHAPRALGRHAAARGAGPRPGAATRCAPARRALLLARPGHAHAAASGGPADPARGATERHLRDARPGRGPDRGRQGRGHDPWPGPAGRRHRSSSTPSPRPPMWPPSWAWPTSCPADVERRCRPTRASVRVPLIGGEPATPAGHALCLLRPEHFGIEEAPDGPASTEGWEVIDRRFSGSEILLELRAADGERLWVEAGSRVRHLGLGDRVSVDPARHRDGRLRAPRQRSARSHADRRGPAGNASNRAQPHRALS